MPRKNIWQVQKEIRQNLSERLFGALDSGVVPWRRLWSGDNNVGFPANVKSKKVYRAINPLLLTLTSLEQGFGSRWWGTLKQWNDLECKVQKGSKGTQVVLWSSFQKDKTDDGGNPVFNYETKQFEKDRVFFLKTYIVFNAEQVEGSDQFCVTDADNLSHPAYGRADNFVNNLGVSVEYGGKAMCVDGTIHMPHRNLYPAERDFHETRFHECIHWSEKAREWVESEPKMGELIAEIGGCHLMTLLGLPCSDDMENHNQHLKLWLEGMQADHKFIFDAATEATKAIDFLLELQTNG